MMIEQPRYTRFVSQIAAHTGLERERVAMAARAVLAVLSSMVPKILRDDIRSQLPDALKNDFTPPGVFAVPEGAFEFFDAVANMEHLPLGFAKEHTAVVCQALVGLLSPDTQRRLVTTLAPDVGALFHARNRLRSPPSPLHEDRETLSSGRPGSRHPLSEFRFDDRDDTLARGRAGGQRPLSEAHPGHPDDRNKG